MQISILTLNFNGSRDTINLIKSLRNQSDQDFSVVVIDNASEKSDIEILENELATLGTDRIRLFKNKENLGFSGGNNVGIKYALDNGMEWVVLLNNDTWVETDFIRRLKGVLRAQDPSTSSGQVGILGIPLVEGDKTAYCGKIQWLKPTLKHIYQLTSLPAYQLYAIGGAVAIHRDVFNKIGFLDEKYFLYFEDADFSLRAKNIGFNIEVAGEDLSVHHHISSSTKKLGSPLLLRYHYRNTLYFNLKNGPLYIKLLVWPWSWAIVIKQLTKLLLDRNTPQAKAVLAGVGDFYKNKYGKI